MGIRSVAGSSRAPVARVFTSNTTYTPTAGAVWCLVEVVGAGGGTVSFSTTASGIGVSTGGGAGAYIRVGCLPSDITGKTITVGVASVGGNGSGSSVGSVITAAGGGVGNYGVNNSVSAGSLGTVNGANATSTPLATVGTVLEAIAGQGSTRSIFYSPGGSTTAAVVVCSSGGSGKMGQGGPGLNEVYIGSSSAILGTGYGSGAGGAYASNGANLTAAAGQPGLVIITEYF